MGRVRKQNIFNTTGAVLKFILFWILVVVQLPILVCMPRGATSVRYMRFFMRILLHVVGVRIRVNGHLSSHRPLLVVSNHISIFEIATFTVAFEGRLLAKKAMEHWLLVG